MGNAVEVRGRTGDAPGAAGLLLSLHLAPPVAERASRRERPSETPHSYSYRWARSLALAALAEFFGVLCDRTLVVDSSQLFLRKWEYPLGRCTVSNIGGVYRYLLD